MQLWPGGKSYDFSRSSFQFPRTLAISYFLVLEQLCIFIVNSVSELTKLCQAKNSPKSQQVNTTKVYFLFFMSTKHWLWSLVHPSPSGTWATRLHLNNHQNRRKKHGRHIHKLLKLLPGSDPCRSYPTFHQHCD